MESYLEALRQAVVLFPILAVVFTVPYVAVNYHKYGSVFSLRILIIYSFVLYLLCTYCLVILPLPTGEAAAALRGHTAQLMPFAFIGDMLESAGGAGSLAALLGTGAFLTTLFNLFMTMPFGVYLRYYFRTGWRKALALSFLLSLFFELTQLTGLYFIFPGSYRIFDVDDLMINTAGSMIGYGLGWFALRLLPSREELDRVSYRRGRQVSFPRRAVALVYDAGVCALLSAAAALTAGALGRSLPALVLPGVWTAYFLLCPLLLRGRTLGHKLTRLRIAGAPGKAERPWRWPVRYLAVWGILCWLPLLLAAGVSRLAGAELLPAPAALGLYGAVALGWLFLLLFETVRAAGHAALFYERWSGTALESTIPVPEEPEGET